MSDIKQSGFEPTKTRMAQFMLLLIMLSKCYPSLNLRAKTFDHRVCCSTPVGIWIIAFSPLVSFYLIYKSDLEPCYQGELKPGLGLGLGSNPAVIEKLDAWLLGNWPCSLLSTDFHNFPGIWFSGYTSTCSTVDILIPSACALSLLLAPSPPFILVDERIVPYFYIDHPSCDPPSLVKLLITLCLFELEVLTTILSQRKVKTLTNMIIFCETSA